MTWPRVRPQADRDIDRALEHYVAEGGLDLGQKFLVAIERAFETISTYPEIGTCVELADARLSSVRSIEVPTFHAYRVYYLPRSVAIDVLCVLHSARDVDGILSDEVQNEP